MTYHGTEADLKKQVEKIDKAFRDGLAGVRAIPKQGLRGAKLLALLTQYPGFAADVFAEFERYRSDALPALRQIVKSDDVSQSDIADAYRLMSKIGEPAHDDLMKLCAIQLANWTTLSLRVEYNKGLDNITRPDYLNLLAATTSLDGFRRMTADERKTVRELRDLWAAHPVLSKLGPDGDKILDRLDRILKQ